MVMTGLVNSRMPRLPSGDEMIRRAMGLLADERFVDPRLFPLLYIDFALDRLVAIHLDEQLVVTDLGLDGHRSGTGGCMSVQADLGSRWFRRNRYGAGLVLVALEEAADLREWICFLGRSRSRWVCRRSRGRSRRWLQIAGNVLSLPNDDGHV